MKVHDLIIFFLCLIAACKGYYYKEYDKDYEVREAVPTKNFYISKTRESYYEALQICREKSMQLVSIDTKRKNKNLADVLKESSSSEDYWTSGNKISKGEWWWLKGEPLEYINWANIQGTYYYHKKCISVAKNGSELVWKPDICDDKHLFICESLNKISSQGCIEKKELVEGDPNLTRSDPLYGKAYYVGEEIITYSKAVQNCREMCLKLLSIENEEKNKHLLAALEKAGADKMYWSSGYYKPSQYIWKWLNGEKINFFSWNTNEPNNARQDEYCIEFYKKNYTVVWNDQPCEEKRMYICETF